MRILIDMQGLQTPFSAHRGVGRYTENLVRELLLMNSGHEFYLALNGAFPESALRVRHLFKGILEPDHIKTWQQSFDTNFMHQNSALTDVGEILRETFLNAFQPDIIFSTNLQEGLWECASTSVHRLEYPTRYCTTLHDVVPLFHQEYLSDFKIKKWYKAKLDHAKASDILLTVSESSKADIIKKLDLDEKNLFVIENGYDRNFFNTTPFDLVAATKVRLTLNIPEKFILYYGGADQHKNLARLLRAYAATAPNVRREVALVLIGREAANEGYLRQLSEELEISQRLFTPGYIEDKDLVLIIKSARAFVFPSTHEGFGLPLLEAMACGVAAIGSRTSSIGEILDNPDAAFDPFDIADIAAKIERVVFDRTFRAETIRRGLERSRAYSWQRSAQRLLEVFERTPRLTDAEKARFDDPVDRFIRDAANIIPLLSDEELARVAESVAVSFPEPRKRRLFLDVSSLVLQDDHSGIQRVTRAIVGELLRTSPQHYDVEVVYTSPDDLTFYAANGYVRETFNAPVGRFDDAVEFQAEDILIYVDLHPRAAIMHRDFNIGLRARGVGVYHVVYDLIPILQPQTFGSDLCEEFREWLATVAVSDGAICISRAVAAELRGYLDDAGVSPLGPLQIGWFHLGADIHNSAPTEGLPSDAAERLAWLQARPTFLMVGTLEPRKGHRQTLASFERLWTRGLDVNLMIVGRQGWLMDEFVAELKSNTETGARLSWISGASDEYLEAIYQGCRCLIAASEAEGFGLPLIEAARHAIPIIARDLPVFREVAGSNVFYFHDSRDPQILSEAVTEWLALEAQALHPQSSAMAWLTWRQSADQLIDVITAGRWLYGSESPSARVILDRI